MFGNIEALETLHQESTSSKISVSNGRSKVVDAFVFCIVTYFVIWTLLGISVLLEFKTFGFLFIFFFLVISVPVQLIVAVAVSCYVIDKTESRGIFFLILILSLTAFLIYASMSYFSVWQNLWGAFFH